MMYVYTYVHVSCICLLYSALTHTHTHTHTHAHTCAHTHAHSHEKSNRASLHKLVCQVSELTSNAAQLKIELEVTRADLEKSREEKLELSRKLFHTRLGRPVESLAPRSASKQIEVRSASLV